MVNTSGFSNLLKIGGKGERLNILQSDPYFANSVREKALFERYA